MRPPRQAKVFAILALRFHRKLDELERKVSSHDQAIAGLINAIRQLMSPAEPKKKRSIGFAPW